MAAEVKEIANHDVDYISNTRRIEENLYHQIESVQKYADDTYEQFRKIHQYGEAWNEEEFVEKEWSSEDLMDQMKDMNQMKSDLDRFKLHYVMGIMSIDGKTLRSMLLPVPEKSLGVMKKLLTTAWVEKCQEAYQRFDAVNKALEERPKDLSKYANYVKMFTQVKDERDDMEAMMTEATSIYSFLQEYKAKIGLEDQSKFDALEERVNEFKEAKIEEATEFISEMQAMMAEETKEKCVEIETKMQTLGLELCEGSFVDPEKIQFAHEVVEELERIGEKQMKVAEEKAQTFNEFEDLIGPIPEEEEEKAPDTSPPPAPRSPRPASRFPLPASRAAWWDESEPPRRGTGKALERSENAAPEKTRNKRIS